MPKQQHTIPKLHEIFKANVLSLAILQPLADKLGIGIDSLKRLEVGVNPDTGAYIFPERSPIKGEVIGLMERFEDGTKRMIKGSKRGLTYEVEHDGEKEYQSGKDNWIRVSSGGFHCPICGKTDGCMLPSDNPQHPSAVVCVHKSEGSVKHLELGYLHILDPEQNKHKTNSARILLHSDFPVVVVEGSSDTCAAMDLGFSAIGRPSAQGGIKELVQLLRGKEAIIIGDNDAGAGVQGMETTFAQLVSVCKKITKCLPPEQFKDLRQWKNQVSLTQTQFLEWVQNNGDSVTDPNILDDDIAHTIARTWLDREQKLDGLPVMRCYKGNWVHYQNGSYEDCNTEEFRGKIYKFLTGKVYPHLNAKGETVFSPYKPTKGKVGDIIDALSEWCSVTEDPPVWLKDMGYPEPENLIAFENGILDVNEYVQGRIKFYNPTPAYFSFNILPYNFNEDADSKIWRNFCGDIFNGEQVKIDLLAQWFGYNCIPDMRYEKLMICTGRRRSGKGTVLNTLASLLGQRQVVSTSFQTLCTEFGYQPLLGKLAVLLGDAKVPNQREAEAALEKILQIVGRDPVGIRRMYLPFIPQVYLRCRFTIAMNDLPNIPDQANALEPRLNILSFSNSYVGREDTGLKSRLQQEAEQGKIINFALAGLKSLREAGKFVVPDSSGDLIEQLRELTTPVSAFITETCQIVPEQETTLDMLYEAWRQWSENRGRSAGIKEQFGRWFLSACPSAKMGRTIGKDNREQKTFRDIKMQEWAIKQYTGVYNG